jgi:hypothetical protein
MMAPIIYPFEILISGGLFVTNKIVAVFMIYVFKNIQKYAYRYKGFVKSSTGDIKIL